MDNMCFACKWALVPNMFKFIDEEDLEPHYVVTCRLNPPVLLQAACIGCEEKEEKNYCYGCYTPWRHPLVFSQSCCSHFTESNTDETKKLKEQFKLYLES